jgi:hypothetical protein
MCRIWKANALSVCLTIGTALMISMPSARADQDEHRDGGKAQGWRHHSRRDVQGSGRTQTREDRPRESVAGKAAERKGQEPVTAGKSDTRESAEAKRAEHGRPERHGMARGPGKHREPQGHRGRWEGRSHRREDAQVHHGRRGEHLRQARFHRGEGRHRSTLTHRGHEGRHGGGIRGHGWGQEHRTVSHRTWNKGHRGSSKAEHGGKASRKRGGHHARGSGSYRDHGRARAHRHESQGRRHRDS